MMLISNEENMPCRAKIYAIFCYRNRACFTKKKSKAQKHIQMMQRCALDFFPEYALGHGPAFWIFPGFTDKGYIQFTTYTLHTLI